MQASLKTRSVNRIVFFLRWMDLGDDPWSSPFGRFGFSRQAVRPSLVPVSPPLVNFSAKMDLKSPSKDGILRGMVNVL